VTVFADYDFVVTPSSSRNQFWVPTGEGNRVRPQRVTYESLTVEVFPVGSPRVKEARLGGVSGTAAFTEGTRDRLRDTSCERNFQTLASRHPDLRGVISIGSSFLPETLRGKGMGLAAYRLLVEHAGKMGLAVVPHYCDTGTPLTSADALRVWDKLAQVPGFDAEGHVVYAPPAKANPHRRNPVIDLSPFVDNQSVDALSRSVWALSPEGIEGHRSSTAREDRDAWARKVLETKQGLRTFGEIGRGDSATVFDLYGTGSRVVKITSDPLDAAVMAEILHARGVMGTPGIPEVFGVYTLGKAPGTRGGTVYAILMEHLYPLTARETAIGDLMAEIYEEGWSATPDRIRRHLRNASPGSVDEAWLLGVDFLLRKGFRASDIDGGNMMKRADGTYVVSDFGLSFPIEGKRSASRDIPMVGQSAPSARKRRK
jgi:predicted GNAT family acetyltransferase